MQDGDGVASSSSSSAITCFICSGARARAVLSTTVVRLYQPARYDDEIGQGPDDGEDGWDEGHGVDD